MNDDIGYRNFDQFRVEKLDAELSAERRDHRTTRKYLCAYRWIACTGWAIAIMSLLGWLPC